MPKHTKSNFCEVCVCVNIWRGMEPKRKVCRQCMRGAGYKASPAPRAGMFGRALPRTYPPQSISKRLAYSPNELYIRLAHSSRCHVRRIG